MADTGAPISGIGLPGTTGVVTEPSALAPLREPVFRSLWIAAIISYTGTWMQNVGAGWLMASLTNSPMMVGLVQAAMSLPVFLVSIPAGALADILDRRRLLLLTQTWMLLAALSLCLLTHYGLTTPGILLLFTLFMGLGNVMNDPAWQAITHEIVTAENFPPAVALNSAGFNVARAVGPALGGVVIAVFGAAAAFLLNAASFLGVIFVLFGWKRHPHERPKPAATVGAAIKAGFVHARNSNGIKAVLIRTAVFSFAASALWAMLPLIGHCYGSVGFGTMVTCFGVGALIGAGVLPYLRRTISIDMIVGGATFIYAGVTAATGHVNNFYEHCTWMIIGGAAWIAILASLNVCAQICSPSWLRARTLSMYLLVLQGGLAIGSSLWGAIAERTNMSTALNIAAMALIVGLLISRKYPLGSDRVQWRPTPVES